MSAPAIRNNLRKAVCESLRPYREPTEAPTVEPIAAGITISHFIHPSIQKSNAAEEHQTKATAYA